MTKAFRATAEGAMLFARVTPNASKNECLGLWTGGDGEERLALRVTAPPGKGRANKAVIKLVADALGLPKSAVSLTAGDKDRMKTLALVGDPAAIAMRLEVLLEPGTREKPK